MATQTLKNVILQLRTGSATQWAASTRILAVGEPGVETDSGRIKIGDGTNLWSALPWSGAAIGKSSTNGALTINGADVAVYVLPTATSKADMLKLTAQTGDVCVISSGGDKGSYILTKDDPTVAANWQLLTPPADAVTSVNGKTGVVTLTTANISEGSNLYWTQARFDTAFATKNSTALKDGATIVHTTDTVVINCGNA